MKNIILISILTAIVILLSGCWSSSDNGNHNQKSNTVSSSELQASDQQSEESQIELNTDHKVFLEISIDTKEDDLQSIADKYGYHLSCTPYNTDTRSIDKNYVYELYDPTQFKNETEESFRYHRSYSHVTVTFYHANDDADTKYIVSCKYNYTRGGEDILIQLYDVSTRTSEYKYWKKVTSAPARKKENWQQADSAEDAVISYLTEQQRLKNERKNRHKKH